MGSTDAEEYIITKPYGLETAPPRHKRQIVDADLARIDDRRSEKYAHLQACQHCGDAVELLEPHAYACLWVRAPIGRIMYKLVFCGQECWIEWLRTARLS
ncbi:hypothetical protein [Halorubrum sp. SD683]|uniref:hypothetical protein n=1 Tax=Halorubrum sp. SD683 TaxID=1855873 RepID=UPI000A2E972C|nr:hypothetical protein [Halorubrum sp. SD683]OTF01858.1 hypothetical protein B9G49_01015 [Halorubrum sp. SD683]